VTETRAAPSAGPEFAEHIRHTIDPHGPLPTRRLLAALAAGERLSVVVAATSECRALHPILRFVDPNRAE